MSKKIEGISFASPASRKVGILAPASYGEQLYTQWDTEDHEKLVVLCKHYNIETGPHMFYGLALALARELYPEPKKRGRKSKWTDLNRGALVVEIERLIEPSDQTHGVEWACQRLAKREPWKSFLERKESNTTSPDPPEAL